MLLVPEFSNEGDDPGGIGTAVIASKQNAFEKRNK
jgi:hypothetical protein